MEIDEKDEISHSQHNLSLKKQQTQSRKGLTRNLILSTGFGSECLSEHSNTNQMEEDDHTIHAVTNSKSEQPRESGGTVSDQNKRTDKRKRDSEVPRGTRKRRGPLCPQKLNKGSKAIFSHPGILSLKTSGISSTNGVKTPSSDVEKNSLREEKLTNEKSELQSKNSILQTQVDRLKKQMEGNEEKFCQMQLSYTSCRKKLIEVLRHQAAMERKLREEKLAKDSREIGRIIQTENSFGGRIDTWEYGERFKDLQVEHQKLDEEMKDLVQKRKELSQWKKKLRKRSGFNSPKKTSTNSVTSEEFVCPRRTKTVFVKDETHLGAQAEIYSLQTCHIKRKQAEFDLAKKELALLKRQHIKFLKIMDTEKYSPYQGKLLNGRYLCTKLIGRGGFSEVWKAYDLDSYRDVACKIHALNERWSDRKKQNFTRHATREAQIQKDLCHPRIVRLYDVFGIDVNTFCTVLELCKGSDFDAYLNANRPLPEREARSIIIQLFEGLKYLAQQKQPIIHYDLKPGNLLWSAGEIKITDFGLSKIMQKDQFEIELTSQGAGTYWYLPPECFVTGQQPPMISAGVDMWSGGCILFEMLYGRRPFGHDMTQEKLLREGTVLSAQEVEFPVSPKVSDEAKDLIRKCLARDHKKRPDPITVLNHPYFSKLRPVRN